MTDAEIIPAVNAASWEVVKKNIRLVESHARWVHLDVADGTFTPNTLWHNPAELADFETPLLLEVHLMVRNPEAVIEKWIEAGARRIIVHIEALTDFDFIKKTCDTARVLLTLSITPETSWTNLVPYAKRNIISFQVLSVHPGLAGQQFIDGETGGDAYLESSYDKIKRLREHCPFCDIEVDGGVKVGIAKKCKEAGANLFAVASAVFGAPDINEAINELKRDVD
ncbi:MAG: hypothetical protein HYT40_02585 [Candidatus Sungbacteria bacterium]|uniref:Ribulose-phosphate 3-epimerase n=1 Tax=Candidatus Sungiibacteriota bacterium TaxID=2750080 RepID=A0A931WN73_9BACT|nr:hypothetical protein [Candidatus Sungbacteria bacterium]